MGGRPPLQVPHSLPTPPTNTHTGLGPTLLRDIPAFSTYFSLYEIAKDHLEGKGHPLWLSSCAAGGLAGVMSWIVVYPCDVIKSVVQTRPAAQRGGKGGMWATGQELLRAHGPRVFFRGMSVALLRALPVNCIVFPVYESSVTAMGRLDPARRDEFRRVESMKARKARAGGGGEVGSGAAAAAGVEAQHIQAVS